MAEVVGHEAVISAEPLARPGEDRPRCAARARPAGARRATLGPLVQELDVARPGDRPAGGERKLVAPRPRVNASSLARSSASAPRARSCASPSAGSVARDRDHASVRGNALERVLDRGQGVPIGHGLEIVEDDHERLAVGLDPVHELVDRDSRSARRRAPAAAAPPARGPRERDRPPSATYVHRRIGSLSPASSVTHASAAFRPAAHARTAVVFPYPAGAATSVSAASSPASSAPMMRGRSTIPAGGRGGASFASASGSGSAAAGAPPA